MPRSIRPSVTERLLARTLERALVRGTKEHPELARSADGEPEVRIVGMDPVRILIIGSGLAVGLGVATHRQALTGALADALHEHTGRGVIVTNRAVHLRSVEQTVQGLGTLGATTFGGVLWCPSLHDVVLRPDRGRYQAALVRGFGLLRETALPGAPIVFAALPASSTPGPMEDVAQSFVRRYDAGVRRVAAPFSGVHVAETPRFTTLSDPEAFTPDYYRRWADRLVSTVVQRVARPA